MKLGTFKLGQATLGEVQFWTSDPDDDGQLLEGSNGMNTTMKILVGTGVMRLSDLVSADQRELIRQTGRAKAQNRGASGSLYIGGSPVGTDPTTDDLIEIPSKQVLTVYGISAAEQICVAADSANTPLVLWLE